MNIETVTIPGAAVSVSSTVPRTISVSLPAAPWGAIGRSSRAESAPDPRITMCNRRTVRAKTDPYSIVKAAIIEFREEGAWLD